MVDFEFFRRHYLGHISTPWQLETHAILTESLKNPTQEFIVENVAPGTGKTTLLHDLACHLTCLDRRMRGLFGSRIENNARRQLNRVRRSLERTSPPKARTELIEAGIAVDAIGCLAADYGLFKPTSTDTWRADEFIVAQFDDIPIEEKEPTWSCYGQNSGVLGNRFNVIFWDDVVDKVSIRTLDAQTEQRAWFDDEAETRLEQGGTMMLVGQRMAPTDLYRYCLDKVVDADPDDEDGDPNPTHIYRHVIYKAHYEDRCQGKLTHKKDAPPYPEGCLLDPYRRPWYGSDGIRAVAATKKTTFLIQFQQEDADPDDILVKPIWIAGGVDPDDGVMYPGCWDTDRDICELPKGLNPPFYSIATVDPSPTKMWALQWWLSAPEASNQSFLMDLERRSMPANELLDWNANTKEFYGWMEDWQKRSVEMGHPITTWIVEVNAAQRFLLAYDHVKRWMQKWGVTILPHSTSARKLDQDKGPWIVRDHFKYGRVRLPGKQRVESNARSKSIKLIEELVRFPNPGSTDDQVYACWFYFTHLPNLAFKQAPSQRLWRPPFMRRPTGRVA